MTFPSLPIYRLFIICFWHKIVLNLAALLKRKRKSTIYNFNLIHFNKSFLKLWLIFIIRSYFFGEKLTFRGVNSHRRKRRWLIQKRKKLIATIIISGNDNFIEFYKENTAADKTMVIAQPIRSRQICCHELWLVGSGKKTAPLTVNWFLFKLF